MNLVTIRSNIEELAMEDMTEDGIHHDDFPDREHEYTVKIIRDLIKAFEIELNAMEY